MQKITTAIELKEAILLLEVKRALQEELLKEQLKATSESLKPINIIRNTFKEMTATPELKKEAMNAAIGYATGVVAKKVFVGKTNNPLTKLLGVVLEMAVANKVARNVDGIKSIGSVILEKLLHHKQNSEKL